MVYHSITSKPVVENDKQISPEPIQSLKEKTWKILSIFIGSADRWELTFLGASIFWISVMGITEKRVIMWLSSHLFLYIGMSIAFHRYFSHKSFRTSRVFQTVLAVWGTCALQGGVLFWSALHRHHHTHCDQEADLHSPQPPSWKGFYWGQMGWLSQDRILFLWEDNRLIDDLSKYKELCFIQRYDQHIAGVYMLLWLILGGFEGLIFGGLLARVTSYQCTALVNSIDHMFGYTWKDGGDCKAVNVWWSLPLQLGENWHANHHQYPGRSSRKIAWWEIDPIHWVILGFEKCGLVWDVKK